MALPTLLALLGSAGIYAAASRSHAGPWGRAAARHASLTRAASGLVLVAGAALAAAMEGPGIGITLFVLAILGSLAFLALAAPIWPRQMPWGLGAAALALAAAAAGGL